MATMYKEQKQEDWLLGVNGIVSSINSWKLHPGSQIIGKLTTLTRVALDATSALMVLHADFKVINNLVHFIIAHYA